ncbi:MAG TPA: PQQ-binding-like beta-propeller repeat protein, partial [Planctomycetota bacterium]|nr:PQQ-binding-like beta-propeller repeat protein [Planctomycetota bacterium]
DGDFFVLSDLRSRLARVEPKTGEVKWVVPLPENVGEVRGREKYEASPLAADGKIYAINFAGQVSIFDAKDGKVIRSIPLNATREYPIRSSVVAAQGQLFIRLNRKLLCIGKKD